MSGVNRCIFIGRLGADPEVKTFDNGAVTSFSIAVSEKYKDKAGEMVEKTEWIKVQAWGKLGEICAKYLAKGKQCYVEGKLQTRSWEKDGQKHYATEIKAESVTFLDGKPEASDQAPTFTQPMPVQPSQPIKKLPNFAPGADGF